MSEPVAPEILRQLLRYEPHIGKLFWRERPVEMFSSDSIWKMWNTRFAGKEAFTAAHGDGYRKGLIFGRGYLAHRVIWAMETGDWPKDQLDHIDHNRKNNRMKNLREASNMENQRNRRLTERNTSGTIGVFWDKQTKKWRAVIGVDGSKIHLGVFSDIATARAVRRKAELKYGFHKNHGNNSHRSVNANYLAQISMI